jgi:hypothetical protein
MLGEGVVAGDRYCRNCGQELQPEDQFCGNCGRPVHATAHVPTPEADVSVPAPQQVADRSVPSQAPHTRSSEDQVQTTPRGPVWPMLAMLAVFLVLGIAETIQGMPATSTKDLGFRIGVGIGGAIVSALVTAAIILVVGVIYYAFENKQGQGVTFREAVFNWPLVIVAGFVAFTGFLP